MSTFLDTPEQIKRYQAMVIKARLELEIRYPDWAQARTLRAARAFSGVNFRTRKQALEAFTQALAAGKDGDNHG